MDQPEKDKNLTRLIRLSELLEPDVPMRTLVSADTLQELGESIKALGVLEPLIVTPQGEKYEIVAGHRRYLAAQAVGLSEIPCVISQMSSEQKTIVRFAENHGREEADALAQGVALTDLRNKLGISVEELGKKLGVSTAYIYSRLATLDYPLALMEALGSKSITLSVAKELSKVTDNQYMSYLLNHAITDGATASTVAGWVLDWQRIAGFKPPPEKIDGAVLSEKDTSALLAHHPNCDFCASTLHAKRRVMLIICGPCWEAWSSEAVIAKAAATAARGSDAITH